ncbi:MAG: NUDIX domain-containing protein [Clostridia bacterium]|nr:NUDIX domain-containing protein [Clostridia bacterium]
MKKLNVIIVYSNNEEKILMCHRKKEPYKGLYNLVGGKIEENEDYLDAAYRELNEETGITSEDIKLVHVMDFSYQINGIELQVYAGKLNKEVEVVDEVNKLYWFDSNEDFFDASRFAGEGNIGHMVEQIKLYKEDIFNAK